MYFCRKISLTTFKLIHYANIGSVLKNSGNLQQYGQNYWRNVWDNWTQSWQPKKFSQQKLSHFEPPLKFSFFLRMRFLNFFLDHMVQKYQNEIAPIFYYGKSPKTNEKDLKIPILWPLDWGQPYWMTLYVHYAFTCILQQYRTTIVPWMLK